MNNPHEQQYTHRAYASAEEMALVSHVVESLEGKAESDFFAYKRKPLALIKTTNEAVSNRQLTIVDDQDKYTVWGVLDPDAWVAAHEQAKLKGSEQQDDVGWTTVSGDVLNIFPGRTPKSTLLELDTKDESAYTELLSEENYRSYDGLFRITVQKSKQTSEDFASVLSSQLQKLTGQGLYDASNEENSLHALKETQYRSYNKLYGPLSEKQQQELDRLQVVSTPHGRLKVVDDGRAIEQSVTGARHNFSKAEDVIAFITSGELISSVDRLIAGMPERGRSTVADMLYGGGDSVYTYLQTVDTFEYVNCPEAVIRRDALRRCDIRGYDTDAYGSRERIVQNNLDKHLGRVATSLTHYVSYEKRAHPEEFTEKLRGVHELCFEGAIDIADVECIKVPKFETDFISDVNWNQELQPFVSDTVNAEDQLRWAWTEGHDAFAATLTALGVPDEKKQYFLCGIGERRMKNRLLAKLDFLGIKAINGIEVDKFIVEA